MGKFNIECEVPGPDEYVLLRKCIEAVKQNVYTDEIKKIFIGLVGQHDSCVLRCTELPILYNMKCIKKIFQQTLPMILCVLC